MSSGYVKIYGSILGSSVWAEAPSTRIVWITMLAMADANGHVSEQAHEIAHIAGVTQKQGEKAIMALLARSYDGPAIGMEAGGFRVNPIRGIKIRKSRQSIATAIKRAVWSRDKGRCVQCSATEEIEYDHILAVAHGGENSVENIQLLCRPCNRQKGPKAYEDRRQSNG